VNLIILGAPGSGKGTYRSRLSDILKIASIATGDIFRDEIKRNTFLGKKVADFVNAGKLVPDEFTIQILGKKINAPESRNGFILDGYPRTIEQARALDKIAKIDAVICLLVPEWIIIERLSNRRICGNCGEVYNLRYLKPKVDGACAKCGGRLYQREDDNPAVVKKRLKVYERQTKPLIDYYKNRIPIIEIENKQIETPPEAVVEKIISKLKKANIIKFTGRTKIFCP
jgi:adenylate kinase